MYITLFSLFLFFYFLEKKKENDHIFGSDHEFENFFLREGNLNIAYASEKRL